MSVLIGAHNNAATIERAIRSMLDQTVQDLEVVVVDDGSSDATAELAGTIASGDPRVRVIELPTNVGIARSLNAGLEAARADYVAIQDADDWSDPTRLERQLAELTRDDSVAVVGCRMREVDERGRELVPRTRFAAGEVNHVLMHFNPIPNTSAAIRRDAALAAGGYDPHYRWAAEYDLWLRLAEQYRLIALDEVLATRRMSTRNVAATREREQIAESITMRIRAMRRRRSIRGASGLLPYCLSYVTPLTVKRAVRARRGQAP
jgi:glycosyltransferase involved in cell wall biosynthesis